MTVTKTTTHVDEAKALLVEQFRGKPDLEALLSAFIAQVQDLEDVLFQLLENRWLDTASGVQLDGIGAIVGLERLGLNDDDYRTALRAQIRLNRSSGTIPDNTTILELLISNSFRIREWFPAAFDVVVSDEFTEDPENVAARISKAAGVRAYLEYTGEDDDYTFTFADADTAQTSPVQGFAEEKLQNGYFDDWTGDDPDNWTVTGESAPNREVSEVGPGEGHGGSGTGAANIYSDSATAIQLDQTVSLVIGVRYLVTFEITKLVSGTLRVVDASAAEFDETYSTEGEKSITFTAGSGTLILRFENSGGAVDATIDSVAVRDGGVWADAVEV